MQTAMQTTMQNELTCFLTCLQEEEKSAATLEQYRRSVEAFLSVTPTPITKDTVLAYKQQLLQRMKAASVCVHLSALNAFFSFAGHPEWRVKLPHVQRETVAAGSQAITRAEYERLLYTADRRGQVQLAHILQTLFCTGIRVSELRHITWEALRQAEPKIRNKGKERSILMPQPLREGLQRYAQSRGITGGPLFLGKNGRPLHRSTIWRQLKALCDAAGVAKEKVFPHNFRHLFARLYYQQTHDIAHLADLLRHSSINTTRIYTRESKEVLLKRLDRVNRYVVLRL